MYIFNIGTTNDDTKTTERLIYLIYFSHLRPSCASSRTAYLSHSRAVAKSFRVPCNISPRSEFLLRMCLGVRGQKFCSLLNHTNNIYGSARTLELITFPPPNEIYGRSYVVVSCILNGRRIRDKLFGFYISFFTPSFSLVYLRH